MQSRYLPALVAGFGTLAFGIVLILVFQSATGDAWAGFPLSKAGLTDEYCERNHFEDFIRQPMNAWSNLCYFFLGLWMMTAGFLDARSKRRDNPLQAFPGMSLWMGLTMIGLCFGSFFFHASLTRLGQHWDMGFTYALSLSLVAMGGYRWMALRFGNQSLGLKVGWLTAAVAAAVLMFVFKWLIDGKIALPILMLLGLALVIGLRWRLARSVGWAADIGRDPRTRAEHRVPRSGPRQDRLRPRWMAAMACILAFVHGIVGVLLLAGAVGGAGSLIPFE